MGVDRSYGYPISANLTALGCVGRGANKIGRNGVSISYIQTQFAKCGLAGSKRHFIGSSMLEETLPNMAWSIQYRPAYLARGKFLTLSLSTWSSNGRRTHREA